MVSPCNHINQTKSNCGGKLGVAAPHVHNFLWVTDRVGLHDIMHALSMWQCPPD